MFGSILSRYGLIESDCSMHAFGNGLINHTWKITFHDKEWLLQRINQGIFKRPQDIMENCRLLSDHLKDNHPGYLFVAPLVSTEGRNYIMEDNACFRLFPFIENSYTCDTVSNPWMAYEAARQFGKFTNILSAFDPALLHVTLPDFHNLTLRQEQFELALKIGNKTRIAESANGISFLLTQREIVSTFEKIKSDPAFRKRVIHHDTKINNVLFDRRNDQGLCVIDLDTVMSGYYFSDVGDMLRTYLSPAVEDEPDFSKIEIREEYFLEITKGYLGEMQSGLSSQEKQYFVYAGKFAIYMQAIRFLTDYLNNDSYYNIKYENHNLIRANNQTELLKRFLSKEEKLIGILKSFI